jgi:aminoglycoside 2''-phosphotransferase
MSANQLATYEKRIRELAPDVEIKSLSLNRQGLVNDVIVVNRELIFRFPKVEHGFKHLKNEARILRFLKNYITLEIPSPIYEDSDVVGYRMIPGETLRRDLVLRLPEDDQQAAADQLAQFLKELHGVPIDELASFEMPTADALMKYEGWVGIFGRIREKVFPLLMPHLRESVTEMFESHLADRSNFEYELRMADTDIMPYHIMFDRQRKRIKGIIDFGCAGLGDPAIDFGIIIYNFGESFLNRFYRVYPDAETYLKRARFYAGVQEVRWLLRGIEANDPWWFAVHVGGAKDIGIPRVN